MKKLLLCASFIVLSSGFAFAGGYDHKTLNVHETTADTAADMDSYCRLATYNLDADGDSVEDDMDGDSDGTAGFLTCTDVPGLGSGATAAEIERIADDSARIVTFSEDTETLTCAANGTGIINYISSANANSTLTLPAASGTGCIFDFVWLAAPYNNGDVIQVTGDDSINGVFWMSQDGGNSSVAFETASDSDKLTFTSSTKGVAQAGVWLKLLDAGTDKFVILGSSLAGTGTEATPAGTGQRP